MPGLRNSEDRDHVGADHPDRPGAGVRRASLPRRLERLTGQRGSADLERTVHKLAQAYGLDVAEVRAELAEIEEEIRRFGPSTLAQTVRQCAAEFGLPEEEVWNDYVFVTGATEAWR